MHFKELGLGGVMVVATLLGCGGGGNGGSGGSTGGGGRAGSGGTGSSGGSTGAGAFTTTVGSDTKLDTLSSSQAMQLCSDFNTYALKLAVDSCKLFGLVGASFSGATSDADLQAACTASYDSCLTSDGGTSNCDPTTVMSSPTTCTATVGDLSSCLDATAALYAQIPSCGDLTAASLGAQSGGDAGIASSPPSCAPFEAAGACAGLSM